MRFVSPERLEDLFDVFEFLERGESVVLRSNLTTREAPSPPDAEGACLAVSSSGSTGRAKLIWHSWPELASEVRSDPKLTGWKWASCFSPTTYAGVQVAVHAWRFRGEILSLTKDWASNWDALRAWRPNVLACTPTFLDLLLQCEEAANWAPQQITLGGEILRPAAGKRFCSRFPHCRFTVVYASAEVGLILKTHRLDGWYEIAGFEHGGRRWRIQDDVLEIQHRGEWLVTGDRVECDGDLIRVVGRADSIANVGGIKVSLDEIAGLAEEVPGVRRAVAFVNQSPIVGQIVGLKFTVDAGASAEDVRIKLERHLRGRLRKEAWPRIWEPGAVAVGNNGKRARN